MVLTPGFVWIDLCNQSEVNDSCGQLIGKIDYLKEIDSIFHRRAGKPPLLLVKIRSRLDHCLC
jgi:hypothetical protein